MAGGEQKTVFKGDAVAPGLLRGKRVGVEADGPDFRRRLILPLAQCFPIRPIATQCSTWSATRKRDTML